MDDHSAEQARVTIPQQYSEPIVEAYLSHVGRVSCSSVDYTALKGFWIAGAPVWMVVRAIKECKIRPGSLAYIRPRIEEDMKRHMRATQAQYDAPEPRQTPSRAELDRIRAGVYGAVGRKLP